MSASRDGTSGGADDGELWGDVPDPFEDDGRSRPASGPTLVEQVACLGRGDRVVWNGRVESGTVTGTREAEFHERERGWWHMPEVRPAMAQEEKTRSYDTVQAGVRGPRGGGYCLIAARGEPIGWVLVRDGEQRARDLFGVERVERGTRRDPSP